MQNLRLRSSISPHFPASWDELFTPEGQAREVYRSLLEDMTGLGRAALRRLDDSLEATMREMGVTFALKKKGSVGRKPWECDLLPQIFTAQEWAHIEAGTRQRLRAFELFLRDVHGDRAILRTGVLPVQAVLGSPHFQRPACGLPRPSDSFLHLSGLALSRTPRGELAVRHHYFGSASGISYMMQNRRALSRVLPGFFEGYHLRSIADAPTDIVEVLRQHAGEQSPTVVLLSPGEGSPAFSEHSFLGRRMGIPVVEGRDLLVHGDQLFLKTISGLESVRAIYTRVADPWLDPLVFRPDSMLGVPGLVQCIRQGSVQLLNPIGSQLADDRALLAFSSRIIRFYLNESPILPTVPTYWLGDLDQQEFVLSHLEDFTIRPLYGERILTPPPGVPLTPMRRKRLLAEIKCHFSHYVAQPMTVEAATLCFPDGEAMPRLQDHIVFALRAGDLQWEIFPGALTRVSGEETGFVASELGGGSKDTWVLAVSDDAEDSMEVSRFNETRPPCSHVTSRVAECFYWAGRYLERASGLATMISTIESLELEELNPTEQKLYRPVWNQMLPPLENPGQETKRSISSPQGRYRLTLDPNEGGSIVHSISRAGDNADSIQESLSVESIAALAELRAVFSRTPYREKLGEAGCVATSRRLCEKARTLIPQFFGVADATMIVDAGWRFCLLGQMLERAIITANAMATISASMAKAAESLRSEHPLEIRLSAFLRLLSSRDAYRRVFQMRVEPANVAELLWNYAGAPRSIRFCLLECARYLRASFSTEWMPVQRSVQAIEEILLAVANTPWPHLFQDALQSPSSSRRKTELEKTSENFLSRLHGLHTLLTDGFLNHQIHLHQKSPLGESSLP